eukprot:969240_1
MIPSPRPIKHDDPSPIVTTLTALSMAAITAIGACSILFAMYVIGCCVTIPLQVAKITNDPTNDIRLYESLLITILLVTAVFGISWVNFGISDEPKRENIDEYYNYVKELSE